MQIGTHIRLSDKKTTTTSKNTKREDENIFALGGKSSKLEQKSQFEETNQKVLAKEERLKRYRDRTKQYRQNRTFQNNKRKFYQQVRGKVIIETRSEPGKKILEQNMERSSQKS